MAKKAEEIKVSATTKDTTAGVPSPSEICDTSREEIMEHNNDKTIGRFAMGAVLLSVAAGIGYFIVKRTT